MSYDNVRLPVDIERGSIGGLGFYTTITPAAAGTEDRNQNWEDEKGEWQVGYDTQRSHWIDDVYKHFLGRRGAAHSFPFREWRDYRSGPNNDLLPTAVGTGNGILTVYQLVKTYPDSARPFVRRIFKPVVSTLVIYVNSIALLPAAWTIDANGIITFVAAPGNLLTISAQFEFDVPCRYVDDRMDVNVTWMQAQAIPSIKIQGVFPPKY